MFCLARDNGKLTAVPKFELLKEEIAAGFSSARDSFRNCSTPCRRTCSRCFCCYTIRASVSAKQNASSGLPLIWMPRQSRCLKAKQKMMNRASYHYRIPWSRLLSRVKRREGRVFPSKRAMQAAFPKACKAAKIKGLMVHDLRRSAVRNLMDAGVQQAVAMKISGHRDASVFQRYNIVDTESNRRCDATSTTSRARQGSPRTACAVSPSWWESVRIAWWEFGGSHVPRRFVSY